MSKLKITFISQTIPAQQIQKTDGTGTYNKYKWVVNAVDERGQSWQNIPLHTFSSWVAEKVAVNSEWNVEKKNFNGVDEFKITDKKPGGGFGGGGKFDRKKVPFDKIAALADMCYGWVESKQLADEKSKLGLFESLLVCAGINIDWDTINSPQEQRVDNTINNLNNVMGAQPVDQQGGVNNQWPSEGGYNQQQGDAPY